MDVVYLTRRIVFLSYPETGSNTTHAANLNDVAQMLNSKHGNSYMVFNLSERKHDLTQFKAQVLEFGWPPNLAPPLQRLCSICKAMDTWLISDPKSVVVLHSKGDKGRIGTVISAYIHYTSICSPNDQLLERLSMKEYYAEKLSPYMHPSQKRYVHYFAGLLSGAIKMNNSSVFLHRIIINGVPNFEITGGCKPFFKIYQGMQHIYTTKIFSVSGRARQIVIKLDPSLQLHGDIMIKCYHSIQQPTGRSSVFRVQFHTCTIDKDWLSFSKEELDDASNDYRFPEDGRVEFHFADRLYHSKRNEPIFDAVPYIDSNENNLSSWDSYENFCLGPEANPQLSPSMLSRTPLIKRETQLDELLDDMIREIHSISEVPVPSASHPLSNIQKSTDSGQTADYGHPQPIIAKYSPTAVISVNGNKQVLSSSPGWTKDKPFRDDEEDKPYHARKNCPPFTYGVSPGSPVLRRKYLRPVSPSPSTDNQFKAENLLPRDVLEEQVFVTDDTRLKEPNSQNWLMKQQEKLKARREGRVWEDRQQREQLLMAELLSSHKRMSPEKQDDSVRQNSSPVPRADSPSKGVSYSTPLHVTIYNGHASTPPPSHTISKPPICRGSSAPSSPLLPSRSSSRDATRNRYQQWQTNNHPLTRQKSDTLADRERPFASVKRAHQVSREQMATNKTPPYQIISSSPVYGNIGSQTPHDPSSDTDMLLTLLEQPKTNSSEPAPVSPTSSKLDELEQSLQALSSSSPPRSPQTPHHGRFSPLPAAQSTPSKQSGLSNDNVSSWSLPMVSSSPPGSPHTSDRPETPAFPVHPGTPYFNHETRTGTGLPPKSPVLSRKDGSSSPIQSLHQSLPNVSHTTSGQDSPYFGQSQRSSMLSLGEPAEVIHHHPLFVKDTSKYWYKPNISREEAISMLKDKPPGTFIVRDSNSFPGAFGLALKVATPPPNVQNTTGDISNELVRHFLIEPTSKGVRLKGCANEPVFGTLSALVYQHSMTPLALPCKLILPDSDPADSKIETLDEPTPAPLIQGAACNLLYLGTADVETLTGSAAIERGFSDILRRKPAPKSSVIHFKVSGQGITLTDNSHKLFFRRHYPLNAVSHCGLDPRNRRWDEVDEENNINVNSSHCFGFIAKKAGTKTDNQCHMFAELEAEQPASAIINFVHKVMASGGHSNKSNMVWENKDFKLER